MKMRVDTVRFHKLSCILIKVSYFSLLLSLVSISVLMWFSKVFLLLLFSLPCYFFLLYSDSPPYLLCLLELFAAVTFFGILHSTENCELRQRHTDHPTCIVQRSITVQQIHESNLIHTSESKCVTLSEAV